MIKKSELIKNLNITDEQATQLAQAFIPVYHTHQNTRKIIEWFRNMREFNWANDLTAEDVFIWTRAIQTVNFQLLVDWEEENFIKVAKARQRTNWR